MLHRTLGKTNFQVSPIGFGAWGIGGQWGDVETQTAIDTVKAALDTGVNFFDTADAYGDPPGLSEELLKRALKGSRDKVLLATKVGNFARRAGHPLSYTTPLHVHLCCDASLHRLGTDYIDVYQCHMGNPTDYTIYLEAFDALKKQGKIRSFGLSTNSLPALQSFNQHNSCETLQTDYSILNRAPEKDLLPYCQEHNIGVIVRGPLAMGVLSGKFNKDTHFEDEVRKGWNEGDPHAKFLARLQTVEKLRFLESPTRTLAQAALQFVVSHPAVSVAIPGAKSPTQARANAAGAAPLPPPDLARIHALTP